LKSSHPCEHRAAWHQYCVSWNNGPIRYYHTGQGLGFGAINLIFPEAQIAVVVLTNTNVKATYLKIANQLTYLLVPPSKEESFARNVFAELHHGHPDRSAFSENLNKYMTDAILEEYRFSLVSLGPVQSFTAASAQVTDGLETRDYDKTSCGHALKLHLLLLPDGRLEDVAITDASMD